MEIDFSYSQERPVDYEKKQFAKLGDNICWSNVFTL